MDKRLILILCLFTIGASNVVNTRCPTKYTAKGLVALYPLDVDVSPTAEPVNGYTGTQAGNPVNGAGKFGNAETFDGAGDYFDCGDQSDFTFSAGFTITLWMKGTGTSPVTVYPMGKRDGGLGEWYFWVNRDSNNIYLLVLDEANTKYMARGWANYGNGQYPEDGTWHFYAFVWDGGTTDESLQIYADGVQKDDTNLPGSGNFVSMTNTSDKVNIGRVELFPTEGWDGSMDDIAIYNRVLTAQEIKGIYHRKVNIE